MGTWLASPHPSRRISSKLNARPLPLTRPASTRNSRSLRLRGAPIRDPSRGHLHDDPRRGDRPVHHRFAELLLVLPSAERGRVRRDDDDEPQIEELGDALEVIDPHEVDGRHH
jgi:hypothetical protein